MPTWVYYSLIDKVRAKKDSHFVESVRCIWKKVKTTSFVSFLTLSSRLWRFDADGGQQWHNEWSSGTTEETLPRTNGLGYLRG